MSEEEMKNIANNILKFRQIGLIEATDTFYDTIQEMLNYIDKLQKENKESKELYNKLLIGYNKLVQEYLELEKVIDLMAEKTANEKINRKERWCKCIKENVECKDEWICKECLKEYFYKKAEEENE